MADNVTCTTANTRFYPGSTQLGRIPSPLPGPVAVFQRFFETIVDLCQAACLVWGRQLYFDATKVEANADIPSLVPRFYYEATTHVADLFADEVVEEDTTPAAVDDLPLDIVQLPTQPGAEDVTSGDDRPWRLLDERRFDLNRPSHRGYHATGAHKKAIRKRQVWVEPLFAEAKEWHGLRRLRLRGLMNANVQGLLIGASQNLKRFRAATGWRRRHAPCGSLAAIPRETWRLSAVYG